jgi:type IV pilus assembly protein PilM
MNLLNRITGFVADPPPSYVFEISKAGIAYSQAGQTGFRKFEDGVLDVSPARDNVAKPSLFNEHVASLAPRGGKRRRAALILPDFSARVQVLDFDAFPADSEEQISLIKFRVRKTVPFDVDSSVLSYHVQHIGSRYDVVTAVVSLEIVARYEAPFRAAGYQPGLVTTSALAALNLAPAGGISLILKLSGHTLCAMVQEGSRLRLARTVELDHPTADEILAVLYPTIAYIEDEMNTRPERVLMIGQPHLASELSRQLSLPAEPVDSRFGTPDENNAGLFGYLQGAA